MSSEVCPFCGKTYKRLKSHLPHCKAAASSRTPSTQNDVTAEQTSPSQQAAAACEPAQKGKKSSHTASVTTDVQTKKSKKVSASKQLQASTSATSTSLPPSANKKKQKLADQMKMTNKPSSATVSLVAPPATVFTKQKNKSLRALIEAAKSEQLHKESQEGTRSAAEDLLSDSAPILTDSLNTRTAVRAETKMSTDLEKDVALALSTDTKPKDAPKKKASRLKKAGESVSATKDASDSLDFNIHETGTRRGDNLLVDGEGETVSKLLMRSRSGHQARITLQDVKAALRRDKTASRSGRASVLSQTETGDDLRSKNGLGSSLSPDVVPAQSKNYNCLVTAKAEQPPGTSSQRTGLQSAEEKSLMSKQASLIPLQQASPQHKLTAPVNPLLSGHLSSQVSQPAPFSHPFCMSEGFMAGHHMTGRLSISPAPTQLSSPHSFLLAPPVRVETDEGLSPEKSQLSVRKENNARSRTEGALTQRRLGQVRLRELPEWLACKTPRNPREAVQMMHGGWQWYHRRYIDVKKGGVGGLGMLLAGYCVLSYIWSYPHIKHDRWRKYH